MTSKQWWTVFAVYDDNKEPFIVFVQAKDKIEAWSKALNEASGVIIRSGIALGKIQDAGAEGFDNVVPIRGKEHAIDVTQVRVTKRKMVVPGHCPKCKRDFRHANAIVETMLDSRQWLAHLSANGKDVCGERDQGKHARGVTLEFVALHCANCEHAIWEGMHGD